MYRSNNGVKDIMKKEIDFTELWKLPDDLKKRVVKGKTPTSKKGGEISFQIAKSLNRLDTHREMRAIAEQIHPSTKYKQFNPAVSAYLKSSQKTKERVCSGEILITDLVDEKKKIKKLSSDDRKNIMRYNNAIDVQNKLNLFYKDLKYFLEGTPEDREYLRKFLKPEKIHYIASVLSCIRNEDHIQNLIKYEGIREEL